MKKILALGIAIWGMCVIGITFKNVSYQSNGPTINIENDTNDGINRFSFE